MHNIDTTQIHFDFINDNIKASSLDDIFRFVENGLDTVETKIRFKRIKKVLRLGHNETTYTIGNGVAILNAKTFGINRKVVGFMRMKNPIDFKADDGKPCDLIAVVLSPQNHGPLHLRRLSRVSRLLKDKNLVKKLRDAENEDVLEILLGTTNDTTSIKGKAEAA